jgi:hypothetical protein
MKKYNKEQAKTNYRLYTGKKSQKAFDGAVNSFIKNYEETKNTALYEAEQKFLEYKAVYNRAKTTYKQLTKRQQAGKPGTKLMGIMNTAREKMDVYQNYMNTL